MRVGASSRGSVFVAMGPLGWLIFGPFIAAGYLIVIGVKLLVLLVILTATLIGKHRAKRRRAAKS